MAIKKATKNTTTSTKTALEKKSDAIVNAQAQAVLAAIKSDEDAVQFAKSPAAFAKKNGFELTSSFVKEAKASVAQMAVTAAFENQLSSSVRQQWGRMLESRGSAFHGRRPGSYTRRDIPNCTKEPPARMGHVVGRVVRRK